MITSRSRSHRPGCGVGAVRPARRRLLQALPAAALVLAGAARAQPAAALPPRNLLVEWREQAASQAAREAAGLRGGSVVIGSDGSVHGQARMEIVGRTRDSSVDSLQQLRVLNGGRGSLRLVRAAPLQFYEVRWTPRGAELTPASLWAESARGLVVLPRWPGGDAPVVVELRAESPGEAGAGAGLQLLTTLQLPLGEWVTVASSAQAQAAGGIDSAEQREWQLRVSAP